MTSSLRAWLVMLTLASTGAGAGELVIAVTPSSRPFSYTNEAGELGGFNVDMGRAICERLGERCRFETMNFPAIVPAVAAGKADIGIANFLRTPERERLVAFTVPYWRSTSSLIGAAGTVIRDIADAVARLRVCSIDGSLQQTYLRRLPAAGSLVGAGSNQAVLDQLVAGRCDAALLPTMQALPFLQSPPGRGFGFLGTPLTQEGLGGSVHMVVRPDQPELRQRMDEAIQALIRDGSHERASRRYFPFSIL
jgi:polar amino acid transport system substrate-binding protein/arginine transport system substrate-binding protein/lysine/arginine/ornithine transport system substrate-binding protein/histidine transport system substrate-binding protein